MKSSWASAVPARKKKTERGIAISGLIDKLLAIKVNPSKGTLKLSNQL